jgi:lysophospholipid acyltransferase (LPLAT)-like uncharacterized protein
VIDNEKTAYYIDFIMKIKYFIIKWFIISVGCTLYRLWFRTVHKQITSLGFKEPSLIAFWHQDIFMAIGCISTYSNPNEITALVSPSHDGDYLTLILKSLDFQVLRGSSSSGSIQAIWGSLRNLRSGLSLMITPDGPKGPALQIKPGLIILSHLTSRPVRLIHFHYSGCWRLKSWDQFIIPKPFSQCTVTVSQPIVINNPDMNFSQPESKQEMEDFLNGYSSDPIMETRMA